MMALKLSTRHSGNLLIVSWVQEVEVNVSTDGHMHAYAGGLQGDSIPLR